MSFKHNMVGVSSRAEDMVHAKLQQEGLGAYTVRDRVIFLDNGRILPKEWVTKAMVKDRPYTIPDFIIQKSLLLHPLPIYLDGVVHKTRGVKNRDDQINMLLQQLRLEPLRFAYSGCLSKKRLNEIVKVILEAMK